VCSILGAVLGVRYEYSYSYALEVSIGIRVVARGLEVSIGIRAVARGVDPTKMFARGCHFRTAYQPCMVSYH
jgi:hypothetical protein